MAIPLKDDRQSISEHFGTAPCFYVATVRERDGVLLSEAYESNPFAAEEKGKGINISEWLIGKGVDTVYTPRKALKERVRVTCFPTGAWT